MMTNGFARACALSALMTACLVSSAFAQLKSLTAYQSKSDGFSLLVPEKWDAIPPKPDELEVLMKLAFDAEKRGGYDTYEMQIMRFTPKGGSTPSFESAVGQPGEDKPPGEPGAGAPDEEVPVDRAEQIRRFREENRAHSFAEWFSRASRTPDAKLPTPITGKVGDLACRTYLIEGFVSQGPFQLSVLAGVIADGTHEWVIFYQVPTKDLVDPKSRKSATAAAQLLARSIKSFKLIEKEATEITGPDDEPVEIKELRKRVKRGLPPSWKIWPTPKHQYVVVHNIPQVKTKQIQFAKDIVKRLEEIRAVYEKRFPPKKPITAISVVRVCQNKEEYHQYGGPGGSAGYFSSGDEELVIYDASKEGGAKDSFGVLFHEAFHQYIHYAVGEFAPHSWFNEGFGDYFAGANSEKNFEIEPYAWRTSTVKNAVSSGKMHRLSELVKMTQAQYYSDASTCYAQGWALVYFLHSKTAKKNPRWADILQIYFDTMVASGSADKACEAAFKDVDMEALEKAYVEFIKVGFK
jgi:hypothetical protein